MGHTIEVARSSVQTWECDQMGHMNVQFYIAKADEGMAALGAALRLSPRAQQSDHAMLIPREQHIRFHRELRPGAPYAISGGVIGAQSEGLILYEEMQNTVAQNVAATFVTRAEWCDVAFRGGLPLPVEAIAKAPDFTIDLPSHGAPRGLDMALPRRTPTLKEAEALNLLTTFRGCVLPEHCDRAGYMTTRNYMARVSDAIPNLIAQTSGQDRSTGRIGGAALEYRFVYRTYAREGDLLILKSGLKSVSSKTYVWCHWLLDAETGECFATSEAVAVAMDLTERKAIEIPPELRARLESLVVPGLSV
ncbi:MAG: thioesterase family protein [Alphaproteobacteria bacterium]|nr:thioesterase family protein [Alphaproteobacteria bacterium]